MRHRALLAAAAAALAADQLTKAWARRALVAGVTKPFVAFWSWRLSFNPGTAFSIITGADGARVLLAVVGVVAAIVLAGYAWRRAPSTAAAVGYGLCAAGALGNAIDRIAIGRVTDFILWSAGGHDWPIFNVADAALVAGVALLALPRSSRARQPLVDHS